MSDCCSNQSFLSAYDLIVIGAGSGGFAASITAAEQGKTVLLVGYATIGGTCVNIGCIPSKNLIRAIGSLHNTQEANRFAGIEAQAKITNWQALMTQKQQLVNELRQKKYSEVLPKYPTITYLEGKAQLTKTGVVVDGQYYQADKTIIATGASNAIPPIKGLTEIDYLDSTTLLELEELPKSLLVIGGGVIGCELAQALSRAGVAVTICTRRHLLPNEEPEISAAIAKYLQQEGIKLYFELDCKEIKQTDSGYELTSNNAIKTINAEKILVSTGRKPNTEALACEQNGVTLHDSSIKINKYMQTSHPNIYAVGDVTGNDMLVYMAAYGAKLAVNNALNGNAKKYDSSIMPIVTFTDPQVARVGLTQKQAQAAGFDVKISVLPLSQVPRAVVAHNTNGLIKLVADKHSDVLLGAHICATEAGDSIQTAVLAIKNKMTASDLAGTIFPYLTMVEGLKLAAQTFDKDVSKLSCCAG